MVNSNLIRRITVKKQPRAKRNGSLKYRVTAFGTNGVENERLTMYNLGKGVQVLREEKIALLEVKREADPEQEKKPLWKSLFGK